jgi:hypothetical protein
MELYLPDRLHFLDPAYDEFTKIVKPVLTSAWAAALAGVKAGVK